MQSAGPGSTGRGAASMGTLGGFQDLCAPKTSPSPSLAWKGAVSPSQDVERHPEVTVRRGSWRLRSCGAFCRRARPQAATELSPEWLSPGVPAEPPPVRFQESGAGSSPGSLLPKSCPLQQSQVFGNAPRVLLSPMCSHYQTQIGRRSETLVALSRLISKACSCKTQRKQ